MSVTTAQFKNVVAMVGKGRIKAEEDQKAADKAAKAAAKDGKAAGAAASGAAAGAKEEETAEAVS